MSFFDHRGEPIRITDADLPKYLGYMMKQEPTWTSSKCILARSGDNDNYIGTIDNADSVIAASDYVPVSGANTLVISMPNISVSSPPYFGLAFYDEDKKAIRAGNTTVPWRQKNTTDLVVDIEVIVPEKASYFRTSFWSPSFRSENNIAFSYRFTPGRYSDYAITHEYPTCKGMENAIRRARQLTDIEWTPLVRIPRYCAFDGATNKHFFCYSAAKEKQKGIPYSGSGRMVNWNTYGRDENSVAGRWGYNMFFVGLEVSVDTFVTAMRYANSIVSEAPVLSTGEASIYGDVCSALVMYSLGLKGHIWPITIFMSSSYGGKYFSPLGVLGTDIDASELRLCDVFYNKWHIAIITDIFRDEAGNVKAVEISEETTVGNASNVLDPESKIGGISRRKVWPVDELVTSYWATAYSLYRYRSFTEIDYKASPYVDTGNEGNKSPIVDYPCIPYLGNKAQYKYGFIVNSKVLIGATGFTTLVVLKDGSEFNRFTIGDATEIEVGFSDVGNYEAYLTDGTNNTIRCSWTVVNE